MRGRKEMNGWVGTLEGREGMGERWTGRDMERNRSNHERRRDRAAQSAKERGTEEHAERDLRGHQPNAAHHHRKREEDNQNEGAAR